MDNDYWSMPNGIKLPFGSLESKVYFWYSASRRGRVMCLGIVPSDFKGSVVGEELAADKARGVRDGQGNPYLTAPFLLRVMNTNAYMCPILAILD